MDKLSVGEQGWNKIERARQKDTGKRLNQLGIYSMIKQDMIIPFKKCQDIKR